MTTKQRADLISSAIDLERTITELTKELNRCKAILVAEAKIELSELPDTPEDYRGCSQTFKDDIGQAALIIFPGPSLIRGFWLHDGKAYRSKDRQVIEIPGLKTAAGDSFKELFKTHYKCAKAFRELAPVLLGKKSDKLIALCEEPSSPRCTFETKESV